MRFEIEWKVGSNAEWRLGRLDVRRGRLRLRFDSPPNDLNRHGVGELLTLWFCARGARRRYRFVESCPGTHRGRPVDYCAPDGLGIDPSDGEGVAWLDADHWDDYILIRAESSDAAARLMRFWAGV